MLLYYTLTYKDIAFKGILCARRPTRLNHITLMFSVLFLFCAFPFASILAYTTWNNTSRYLYIFNKLEDTSKISN